MSFHSSHLPSCPSIIGQVRSLHLNECGHGESWYGPAQLIQGDHFSASLFFSDLPMPTIHLSAHCFDVNKHFWRVSMHSTIGFRASRCKPATSDASTSQHWHQLQQDLHHSGSQDQTAVMEKERFSETIYHPSYRFKGKMTPTDLKARRNPPQLRLTVPKSILPFKPIGP